MNFHVIVVALGCAALLNTDLGSTSTFKGAILPLVDLLFFMYLLALLLKRASGRSRNGEDGGSYSDGTSTSDFGCSDSGGCDGGGDGGGGD